jgi:DNA-binding NarL/FixJ family response regulator
MRPRVLLAYSQRLIREALARLLEPESEVVVAVADWRAVVTEAPGLRPDVAVIDISIPLLNGLDAARQLRRVMPQVKLIFLTINDGPDLAAEAFRAGASVYLLQTSAASELLQAIREVHRGQSYVMPVATRGLVDSVLRPARHSPRPAELSPRRREVLQLLAEGHTMKQIARLLGIKPRTVAFHKYGMMDQLGIASSAELVRFAVKQHVLADEVVTPSLPD